MRFFSPLLDEPDRLRPHMVRAAPEAIIPRTRGTPIITAVPALRNQSKVTSLRRPPPRNRPKRLGTHQENASRRLSSTCRKRLRGLELNGS